MALYDVSTTDGGKRWQRALVQEGYSQMEYPGFTGAGCSSSGSDCVAVSEIGSIALSRDGGRRWSLVSSGRRQFESLDGATCAASVGCLVVGTALDGGGVIASLGLRASTTASRMVAVGLHSVGGEWTSISCPDAVHCVAIGGGPSQEPPMFGEVMTSIDGGWSWVEQRSPSGVLGLDAVSCPSTRRCYATGLAMLRPKQQTMLTDEIAVVLESLDGGRTWRRVGQAPGIVTLSAISCPNLAACSAVGDTVTGDADGSDAVLATTDGGLRWHEEAVPAHPSGVLLSDISCPSVSDCWAGGPSGLMATEDGGRTWQQLDPDYIDSLSCSSVSHCVAMSVGRGWELVGAGMRAHFVTAAAPALSSGSSELVCPSAKVCIAAGTVGDALPRAAAFMSTDDGRSWSRLSLPSLLATSGGFQAPGTVFSWPQAIGYPGYSAVACSSGLHCVVLGGGATTEVAVAS